MKTQYVAAAAAIFCCAVILAAAGFGYSLYRSGQAKNSEFRDQLQLQIANPSTVQMTHMPLPIPPRSDLQAGNETPAGSVH